MVEKFRYLLAVDPSLTCSGWALFLLRAETLVAVGKVKSDPPRLGLSDRLVRLQDRIEELLDRLGMGKKDVLVCEGPTSIKDPHNAFKVEHVRSIFETVARSRGTCVPGRINPRSVQSEVMGLYGKQIPRNEVKAAAVKTAVALYGSDLHRVGLCNGDGSSLGRHQDIVDAMLVGRFALTKCRAASDGGFSLEDMFAETSRKSRRSWRTISSC